MSKVVVGGQELNGGMVGRKYLCSKCKRGIHNYISKEKGLVLRCTSADRERCECTCKSHYSCRYGKLHPYEDECHCEAEHDREHKYSAESERQFQQIMAGWKSSEEPAPAPKNPTVQSLDPCRIVFNVVSAIFHKVEGSKTRCGLGLEGFCEVKGTYVPDTAKWCHVCGSKE